MSEHMARNRAAFRQAQRMLARGLRVVSPHQQVEVLQTVRTLLENAELCPAFSEDEDELHLLETITEATGYSAFVTEARQGTQSGLSLQTGAPIDTYGTWLTLKLFVPFTEAVGKVKKAKK